MAGKHSRGGAGGELPFVIGLSWFVEKLWVAVKHFIVLNSGEEKEEHKMMQNHNFASSCPQRDETMIDADFGARIGGNGKSCIAEPSTSLTWVLRQGKLDNHNSYVRSL